MNFILRFMRSLAVSTCVLLFAPSVFAQQNIRATPHFTPISEADLEAKIVALRNTGANPDDLLYVCYTLTAVPRGGENPKKADETVYQTGLQKQAEAIETAYRNINGVQSCKFNFTDSQVSFFVQRSAVRKREVITDISRLLDGLGFEYNLLGTSLWQ